MTNRYFIMYIGQTIHLIMANNTHTRARAHWREFSAQAKLRAIIHFSPMRIKILKNAKPRLSAGNYNYY